MRLVSFFIAEIKIEMSKDTCKINISDGVVEWLTHQTSNIRITSRMGSYPVRGKPLFPLARNFTLIAQY